MEARETEPVDTIKSLAVNLSETSVAELNKQRTSLNQFISSSLRREVDFGIIPGVKKASLFKPGAEKICKLFQLGSRISEKSSQIDIEKNFAMFNYTVEIFHIPTGKAIAQCEGSANSQEKKYKERTVYVNGAPNKEPTPIADILNTLQKMSQKRAYVGAVIMATGASDFFTQDVEDMDPSQFSEVAPRPPVQNYNTAVITEPQVKRLYAIAFKSNWTDTDIKNVLMSKLNINSATLIKRSDYESVCTFIETHPKNVQGPEDEGLFESGDAGLS